MHIVRAVRILHCAHNKRIAVIDYLFVGGSEKNRLYYFRFFGLLFGFELTSCTQNVHLQREHRHEDVGEIVR